MGPTKTDFKKTLDCYQAKSGVFRVLDVPPLQYLMVDGHGDPNSSPDFTDAVQAQLGSRQAAQAKWKRLIDPTRRTTNWNMRRGGRKKGTPAVAETVTSG